MAAWRRGRRVRLHGLRARPPLRRGTEQRPLALGEELFQKLEFVLGAEGDIAAEAGKFGGERLDLGVEFFILALEEHRDLTQQLRIADLIETQHERTTSSSRTMSKKFLRVVEPERRGRQRDAPDERTAFEEQLQLAHREPYDARVGRAPQTREAPALEPLGVNAEAGPVPEQDLGALARRVHEEVAIARQRISREPLTHERAEPVEAFAQVGRRAVRPDGAAWSRSSERAQHRDERVGIPPFHANALRRDEHRARDRQGAVARRIGADVDGADDRR